MVMIQELSNCENYIEYGVVTCEPDGTPLEVIFRGVKWECWEFYIGMTSLLGLA